MYLGLYEGRRDVRETMMRNMKFRSAFPSCIHRKVSDEQRAAKQSQQKALEMGDFPLQVLETKRKERLAELKAECLELKNQLQLSETSLQTALLKEAQFENELALNKGSTGGRLSGRYSKSMHELRRLPRGAEPGGTSASTLTVCSEESMRKRREEKLQMIRRELEEFAIKYSIGEFAEKIDGLDRRSAELRKKRAAGESEKPTGFLNDLVPGPNLTAGPLLGADTVNAAILLRIQRQREQELQRARLELKHLAFRLKHKLDEEGTGGGGENKLNS